MNTSEDVILVDSDVEFQESQPAQKRGGRTARRCVGKQKPQAKQNRKSSRQGKKSVIIIDEDDSLVISKDSICSVSVDNAKAGSPADSHSNELHSPQYTDVSTVTENSLTAVSLPRRTARRGLAKHKHEIAASDNTLPQRAAVYSQAVAGFKTLLYGPDSAVV
ncbi:unnamed protein product, partial [Candidula unifasciata]